jgi:hypothetical protein
VSDEVPWPSVTAAFGRGVTQVETDMVALLDQSDDPVRRGMLSCFVDHWHSEFVEFDIDALMGTLVPQPEYQYFGSTPMRTEFSGQTAVRDYYLATAGAGAAAQTSFECSHVLFGNDAMALEGWTLMTLSSDSLGLFDRPEAIDVTRSGIIRLPTYSLLPFRDGLMVGERVYFDGPITEDHIVYAPS